MEQDKGGYHVVIRKKVNRRLRRLPGKVVNTFFILVEYLRRNGPIAKHWPNFSKIGKDKYHCHLGYSWVACWHYEKETITIEVYYVGSRENAPY